MDKQIQIYLEDGLKLLNNSKYSSAETVFRKALKKYPHQQSIYTYLIPCLMKQLKYADALKFSLEFHKLGTMLETSSTYLGTIEYLLSNFQNAYEFFKKVLSINPNNQHALINQAAVLNKLNDNNKAIALLEKALSINPNNSSAYRNLGFVYEDICDFNKAEKIYLKALVVDKNDFQSQYALAQLQLSNGNYKNGWMNYESRWLKGDLIYRYSNIPKLTHIENLNGKKILIWYEQGLGDSIQFSRYVRRLIQMKAIVTFEVQEPLSLYFEDQFECNITTKANHLEFDYQLPLLSLPLLFSKISDHLNFVEPYFNNKKNKVLFWHQRLNLSQQKLNLGITISGNKKQIYEHRRKIKLNFFLDFLKYCNIYLIQKEISDHDQQIVDEHKELIFLGKDNQWQNFLDTAAIVENMDFIISIDTSTIHLAGSMNKDALLLLSKPAEWRWTQNNTSMPNWYQSVKVLRQKDRQDWDSIKSDIEKIVKDKFRLKFI